MLRAAYPSFAARAFRLSVPARTPIARRFSAHPQPKPKAVDAAAAASAATDRAAHWFRAVDEPLSKPKKFNYQPSGPPTQFEAFALSDSQRLEAAYSHRAASPGTAQVEIDGLITVDLARKTCFPTYYDGPAFAVRRVLWFEQLSTGKLGLVSEELEAEVEAAHQRRESKFAIAARGRRFKGEFVTSGSLMRATIHSDDGWLPLFSKRELVRGPPDVSQKRIGGFAVRPAFEPRPVEHLVFCVHGIGQLLSLRYEQVNFVKDVDMFRRELTKAQRARDPANGNTRIQVLPVMWRHILDDTINGLHPQQLFGSVNVAADAVLDFVMYLQDAHRDDILRVVAEEMRRMFRRFCELDPAFAARPRVSIVGHSLGSVIAHDLVSRSDERLPFDVTNLFMMGSPAGVLALMNRVPTIDKGRVQGMYNILRRADPIAARLEPIVTRNALDVVPQPLPGGGTNLLKQLKELTGETQQHLGMLSSKATAIWNTMVTREKPETEEELEQKKPPQTVDLSALRPFNRHGRLDFSVTEAMDISLLLGLAGHLMYLDNEDVAAFVLDETIPSRDSSAAQK